MSSIESTGLSNAELELDGAAGTRCGLGLRVVKAGGLSAGIVLMLSLLGSGRAWGQTAVAGEIAPNQYQPVGRPAQAGVLPSEILGADDLLEIMVSYCPELSRSFRVSSDGTLALPLLKTRIKVAGLTPIEVSDELQKTLVSEHVLNDPTVNISVLEYRSRPVSVMGAVAHPLTFQATGHMSLLDALAQAGGLTPSAGGNIVVTKHEASGNASVRQVPVKELLAGKDGRLNLELNGGEEIRVPEAEKIFVAGNVHKPGMYTMQGDSETTVIKAIALSAGLDSYSSHVAYIYRRSLTGGDRQELQIPLQQIIARKSPDVDLHADDILYIPDAAGRKMTAKVLAGLAGFGSTAVSGMLIYK